MDIKEIQNLIKFVAKSGASEVKLEMDDVMMGEAEQITTTATKYSRDEIDGMKNPDGSFTIPTTKNESTQKLFKKFLNRK